MNAIRPKTFVNVIGIRITDDQDFENDLLKSHRIKKKIKLEMYG